MRARMMPYDRSANIVPVPEAEERVPEPVSVRVLVVEDEALIALSLIADLTGMGCNVIGRAASGEQATEIARHAVPDLVLMDIHLAGRLNGIEAAACIQAICAARIVFITAHAEGPDRALMEALSPMAILGKPYDPEGLAALVRATADQACRWERSLVAAS